MEYDVEKKIDTGYRKHVKASNPSDVYNLEEVQAIKDAIKEHILFIGLNKSNEVKKVSLLGIGNGGNAILDSKDVIRAAILNACDKAILVHNHPSNSLNPSRDDIKLTNTMYSLLKPFNIELLDHVIVTEENYASMSQLGVIDKNYESEDIRILNQTLLKEENARLKLENEEIKNENDELKFKMRKGEIEGMRTFESVIIMSPKLTEEEAKQEISKYKEMFEGFSDKEVETEDLGLRKLAYSVRGNDEGRYAIFTFEAENEDISKVEREYRTDDNVIKFLTIESDKVLEQKAENTEEDNMENNETMDDDMEM